MSKEKTVEEENHKRIHDLVDACARYTATHQTEFVIIQQNYSGQVSESDLIKLSYNMYIDRFYGIVKTLKTLSPATSPQALLEHELAVGILLRTCILDCLEITVWLSALFPIDADGFRDNDKKGDISWLSKIFSSSFSYAPKPPKESSGDKKIDEFENVFYPAVKKEFLDQARYFRVDLNETEKKVDKNLRQQISSDDILTKIEENKTPIIRRLHDLYTYYSKFDHFSPIPYLVPSSNLTKLSRINSSLRLISHTISEMLLRAEDPFADEICEILGETMSDPH